mmetsp:Transcript_2461/g.2837  ORF Transcript_2461/g.2837 Transcript_2461/m.2837 type:complete len:345 (-) Transcript_2461:314-1348(-)
MMGRNNNNNNNNDGDSDEDDHAVVVASSTTTSTFVLTLMDLPMTARLDIWNFLGETQEEMSTLTLLSKQSNRDSKHSGIEWQEQLLPVLEISPTHGGSTEQLFHSLLHHHTNNDPHHNKQTTPYRTMTVNDMHKFNKASGKWKFTDTRIQLDRITSLNISSLPSGTTNVIGNCYYFPSYLAEMLPNLLYLDLSRSHYQSWFNHGREIQEFTKHCPRLEKITWNNVGTKNNKDGGVIFLNGIHMQDATKLRVINMDDSDFFVYMNQDEMSDLHHHPDKFIFHKCCHALERVSLRNARDEGDNMPIKQEALIKFVRSVPTLRWFRSDLRPENIEMLTKEHPKITFC